MAVRQRRLGAILLKQTPLKRPPDQAIAAALLAALRKRGIASLPFGEGAIALRQRVALLRLLAPDRWPDFSDGALEQGIEQWLGPSLSGVQSLAGVTAALLDGALRQQLDWKKQKELGQLAPSHFVDRKSTRLNSSHIQKSRMPSSA